MLHVLGLEALSVELIQEAIVGAGAAGEGVDGGVGDANLEVVDTGMQEGGEIDAIGRRPEGSGALVVDGDDCCFANGRIEEGPGAEMLGRWWIDGRARTKVKPPVVADAGFSWVREFQVAAEGDSAGV